jgi:hypothetical protein
MVVPVHSPFAQNSSTLNSQSYEEQNGEKDGLLRNEFGQAYLSVQGDSSQDGAYVILDRQWRNSSGQRWKFINNQLVNDHGISSINW